MYVMGQLTINQCHYFTFPNLLILVIHYPVTYLVRDMIKIIYLKNLYMSVYNVN